jgi:hypothetical protein
MKFFITMGGCIGFVLTLASSLHAGHAPAFALRDAGIGCLAAALLFRGAHWAFFTSLQSHVRERAAAMQQSATETTPAA